MRKSVAFGIVAASLLVAVSGARAQSLIYIVRHAEKASETGDTPLSPAGFERAKVLGQLLKTAGVKAIYTSDALRTKQTAEPLATELMPMVNSIDGGDVQETVQHIKTHHSSDVVLIVGHSNTVPQFVKAWAAGAAVEMIQAGQFDRIFIVQPTSANSANWSELRYGVPTP